MGIFEDTYEWTPPDRNGASLDEFPPNYFHLKLTSPQEVKKIIKTLKNHKAPGPDGINNPVLKNLSKIALVYLVYILNACIMLCYFPKVWREGKVIPLPKPGKDRRRPDSYRPITLLNSLSKLLEAVLHSRLVAITDELGVLPEAQYGFRRGRGTGEQLLRVFNYALEALDRKRWKVIMLALDLKKAFDSVWHAGLLFKLHAARFPPAALRIIHSYLEDRSMSLHAIMETSDVYRINFGVPQGSILGPLLFILYTSDIPAYQHSLLALYADDAALLTKSRSPRRAKISMSRALDLLLPFFTKWRLVINPEKTQAIVFSNNAARATLLPFRINNVLIPWTRELTYLGVKLDPGLWMHQHTKYVCDKATRTFFTLVSLLGRHSYLAKEIKVLFYKVLIRPILAYAVPIWASGLSVSSQKKLQVTQNKMLRIITNSPWYRTNNDIHLDTNMELFNSFATDNITSFHSRIRQYHPALQPDDLRRRRNIGVFAQPRPPDGN